MRILTDEQNAFLLANLDMKSVDLAKELNITRRQARNLKSNARHKIRRMKTEKPKTNEQKPKPKKLYPKKFILNPEPPTQTTEMLICRYYEKTGDINDISLELGRTEEYIKSVLDKCKANGMYERYNAYGRVK
jgi:hypothetical protein